MSRPLEFHIAAEDESVEDHNWYERRSPGLGKKFADQIDRTLDLIRSFPESYPIVRRDVRQALVKKFPYAIYIRILPDRIHILAVFNTSRDPAEWQWRS